VPLPPRCTRCGYELSGLGPQGSITRCPECSSDQWLLPEASTVTRLALLFIAPTLIAVAPLPILASCSQLNHGAAWRPFLMLFILPSMALIAPVAASLLARLNADLIRRRGLTVGERSLDLHMMSAGAAAFVLGTLFGPVLGILLVLDTN